MSTTGASAASGYTIDPPCPSISGPHQALVWSSYNSYNWSSYNSYNWSSYNFIHSQRRNRLTPARARDLVYVFTNLRLVRRIATSEEAFIAWDEGEGESEGEGEGEGEIDV